MNADTPILEVRGYGKVMALHDAQLVVHEATVVTVIGPNGAGKSTLLNGVMELLQSAGDVILAGRSVARRSVESRVLDGMSLVPERRQLFPDMPVIDDLLLTEMMLTGHVVSAAEGYAIGLAHYVTPAGDGMRKARELAKRIAGNAPLSNFAILQALPLIAEQPMSHGLMTEALMGALTQGAPEAKARVNAFLDKRAPKVGPA